MDLVEAYVDLVSWVLLAMIPGMAIVTVKMWALARRYWPYKLPFVVALVCTTIGAGVTWLGYTVIYRWYIGPVPTWYVPITATSVVAIAATPFVLGAFVVYLDNQRVRRRRDGDGIERAERRWN